MPKKSKPKPKVKPKAKVEPKPKPKTKPKIKAKPQAESKAEIKKKVMTFLDGEIAYWRDRSTRPRGLLITDDDRSKGAISALRRAKGRLAKEVF